MIKERDVNKENRKILKHLKEIKTAVLIWTDVFCTNLTRVSVQMEMRSQDQALVRQLMELHSGIQELSQELSEEEEEGSSWDSGSEDGSGSFVFGGLCQKTPWPLYLRGLPGKALHRRSSVP